MPVPKRKRSKTRRDKRFANKGIKPKQIASCSHCKTAVAPHQVCKECGYYKGTKVLSTKVERAVKRAELQQTKVKKAKEAEKTETQE